MAKDQSRINPGDSFIFDTRLIPDNIGGWQGPVDFTPFDKALQTFRDVTGSGKAAAGSGGTTTQSTGQKPEEDCFAKRWFGTPCTFHEATGGAIGVPGGINFAGYFERGVIIILGFIFVAVGLSMFRVPIVTPFVEGTRDGFRQGLRESLGQ